MQSHQYLVPFPPKLHEFHALGQISIPGEGLLCYGFLEDFFIMCMSEIDLQE